MITRILKMSILILSAAVLLGCDPVFMIQGSIYSCMMSSDEHKTAYKLKDVNVKIRCAGDYIPSGLQTKSDDDGFYRLRGIGIPKQCELIFDHPDFKKKTIKLDPSLHKAPDLGGYGYKLNVELEPLSGKQ